MLPPFDPETGRLPEGEHAASWEEPGPARLDAAAPAAPRRAGRSDRAPRRRRLCPHLAERKLRHRQGRTRRLDACWEPTGVDLDVLDPIFFDFADGRAAQKARFGGEWFPNVVESGSGLVFADFFKNERDGGHKGIVVLTIGGSP